MAPAAMSAVGPSSLISKTVPVSASRRCRRAVNIKRCVILKAQASSVAVSEDQFLCKVTEEGRLVCERLEPGNYKIQGKAGTVDSAKEGTVSYCYVLDDGSVVCENIPSGEYAITKATDDDLPEMVVHASKLAGIKAAHVAIPTSELAQTGLQDVECQEAQE